MSEAIYERYKEALRRGHVAALRGRLDDALAAYSEAASIAPERPLPYTSMGGIQLRMTRFDEALASFGAALDRAPRDEAALLGRAEVLQRLGRPADAAAVLDLAAEVQEAAGRPVEALDSAARALELAESRPRRRLVRRLVEEAATTGGEAAEVGIARATALLEVADRSPLAPGDEGAASTDTGLESAASEEAEVPVAPGAETPVTDLAAAVDAEPVELGRAFEPFGSRPPSGDPILLALAADEAAASGDPAAAREALLAAAAAEAAAGLGDSALDACYRALAVAPGDADLHLALVDLYMARGWHALAARKLALLERLVVLDDDGAALERVRARAASAFLVAARADDPPTGG